MKAGCLYIVATPIGHLADMTRRAVETLKSVDLIAAEDTRHSRKLLASLGINTRLVALHDHNERTKSHGLVERMQQGQTIALISDAGTPMISDPGYHFVRAAQEAGIRVSPIPGASAVITALSASGLSANRFYFHGFLPEKRAARKAVLSELGQIPETLVFYESGKRVSAAFADLCDAFGEDREAVIARELTKLHETIVRDSLKNLRAGLQSGDLEQRGEFVVLVEGHRATADNVDEQAVNRMIDVLITELPAGKVASMISKILDVPRKQVYQQVLDRKSWPHSPSSKKPSE